MPPEYYDQLETHLRFLHQSPPLIARLLTIIISVGFLGFSAKLFRPSEANVLFDGASLVLYVIGAGIYIANIVKGLRAVSAGRWNTAGYEGALHDGPLTGQVVLSREDSLRVLAASNTILALVLVGVLVLQAGQWYAERKEADDFDRIEKEEREARAEKREAKAAAAGSSSGHGGGSAGRRSSEVLYASKKGGVWVCAAAAVGGRRSLGGHDYIERESESETLGLCQ